MKRISFIIVSIATVGLFLIGMKPKINPFVSAFDKDGYVTFSGNGINFLFDTGANITLLYADTVPESFYPFMQADAKDIAGNDFSVKKYFSFYTCLGNIEGNLWTVVLLPRRFQWQHIHGVIGTDMIDRCNWLLDFEKGTISNVHPFVSGTPDMVLRYKKEGGLYYVEEMELNGVKCSHVLIDTGYDRSDFLLPKQNIEQMSDACFLKKDTCYGFMDAGSVITVYEVAQGKVNQKLFKNVTLATLASRRTIGISFFKRFSQVVLDTRQQEIKCYCLKE
ncbi:hypothetical protein QVO10_03950 [Bacteroides gallinaceum]|uniref:Peptidase A2 domain-containing protein n=1 Tax=Bacteroides gallinaceum TaxID=1462571 RepID=A0ABT7X394_9BACE|nr:hypothetical protein [Bacteroides gallinaceum]MDN0048548.1 hypothetical protein [Bacteroides gallinaceum]